MPREDRAPATYSQVFRATAEGIEMQCRRAAEMLTERGLDVHRFSVQLLLREALNNAVFHGSGGNAEREIKFVFRIAEDAIEMTVGDDGPGFNWRAVLGRRMDDSAASGRGLAIMMIYADDVSFNEQGNALTLRVNIAEGRQT
jgi:serine/threonine-protein kinase RsbW